MHRSQKPQEGLRQWEGIRTSANRCACGTHRERYNVVPVAMTSPRQPWTDARLYCRFLKQVVMLSQSGGRKALGTIDSITKPQTVLHWWHVLQASARGENNYLNQGRQYPLRGPYHRTILIKFVHWHDPLWSNVKWAEGDVVMLAWQIGKSENRWCNYRQQQEHEMQTRKVNLKRGT